MIVEVNGLGISFTLDSRKPKHLSFVIHTLTIWEEGCGYLEIILNDEELENLRRVLGCP